MDISQSITSITWRFTNTFVASFSLGQICGYGLNISTQFSWTRVLGRVVCSQSTIS